MNPLFPRVTTAVITGFFLVGGSLTEVQASSWQGGGYYFNIYAGSGWYTEGKDTNLNFADDKYDRYKDNSDTKTSFIYGLGAGWRFDTGSDGYATLGLGWYGDSSHEYKGYVDQFGSAENRDFSYSYKVQSQRFVAEASYYFPIQQQLEALITGGLGMSWNKFKDYKTSVLTKNETSVVANFGDESKSTFAWQIGAGLAWAFDQQWKLSVLYLYADNGKAESKTSDYYNGKRFETGNITSHNLLFSLNYLF